MEARTTMKPGTTWSFGPVRQPMAEPGALGTIIRPDGSAYATYDRHPLCTYLGDTAPDQANGNSLNQNGGLWHEVTSFG